MFLFGLMAVSVARGQVAPDAIQVFGSTSNTCVGDGLPGEAQNLTQDDNTGNIGIGTCKWSANLTVKAFAKSPTTVEIVAQNRDGNAPPVNLDYLLKVHTLTPAGYAPPGGIPTPASDNALLVVTDASQSVGIGTYKPLATLHVVNINASQKIPALWVQNQTGKGNIDALYVGKSGLVGIDNSSSQAALNITNYNDGNRIPALWVQNASSGDAMYIDPYGNVGIDNESPQATLDVTGSANIQTNLNVGIGYSGGGNATIYNGGEALDLINSTNYAGWANQILFKDASSRIRHLIFDDYTSGSNTQGNLVIVPGYYGNGNNVVSILGKVQIGNVPTSSPAAASLATDYSLYVQTGIISEKYKCALSTTAEWSDYVFDKDYKLAPLSDVEKYIKDNHHLPDVPSTEDVHCDGVDLEQMDVALLKKIEELTLYVLDLKKENTQMKAEIANLKK